MIAGSETHTKSTITLKSGGDSTMKGAVAQGEKVLANVGGDLKLESLQDTSSFDAKQQSLGVTVSFGYGKVGGSVSASQSKVKAHLYTVHRDNR